MSITQRRSTSLEIWRKFLLFYLTFFEAIYTRVNLCEPELYMYTPAVYSYHFIFVKYFIFILFILKINRYYIVGHIPLLRYCLQEILP